MKKFDVWELFYRGFSKDGIGFMFIVLSVVEALSIKLYGLSFYESSFMFVKANEGIFLIFIPSFIAFLCVFAVLYYIYSKKYKQHGLIYRFIILPIIFSAVFIVFLSVIFFIILVNFFENFVFQKFLGIYGKSVISLLIGIVWLVIVRVFWKSILSEKS